MYAEKQTDRRYLFKMEKAWGGNQINKRGLSAVVTTVLLISLTVGMIALVWVVVNGMVKDQLSGAGSCYDAFGQVSLNNRYTCYNSTSEKFQFSISLGDVDIDEVVVAISADGSSISFNLPGYNVQIDNIVSYPSGDLNVSLPKKNGGRTYLFDMITAGFSGAPDSIRVAPIVDGDQCEVADSIDQIDDCQSLVS